ncbi:phage gene 29 protein family protein [Rhodococcus zopfii]
MGQHVPTVDDCDRNEPTQKFQFMFVALPFIGDTPFTPQDELLEKWSKRADDIGMAYGPHLAELADENGMIHVSQLPQPKIKLLKPNRGPDHTLNVTGWVGIDEPEPGPVVIPDMGPHTPHEREIVAEQLRYFGTIPTEKPALETAQENLGPLFDPSEHTPSTVNGYLMGVQAQNNTGELRRVIAAEMAGKRRDQILRKWPGV